MLVVYYIPEATKQNPQPTEQLVYRGKAPSFAVLWQSCVEYLPEGLLRRYAKGRLLVGRPGDDWIENPTYESPAAKLWLGSASSGPVMNFLDSHTMLYFKSTPQTAVA